MVDPAVFKNVCEYELLPTESWVGGTAENRADVGESNLLCSGGVGLHLVGNAKVHVKSDIQLHHKENGEDDHSSQN